MGHPRLSVGESILLIHTQRTVIYGVVIVSRNIERTNENDGLKMTVLEHWFTYNHFVPFDYRVREAENAPRPERRTIRAKPSNPYDNNGGIESGGEDVDSLMGQATYTPAGQYLW